MTEHRAAWDTLALVKAAERRTHGWSPSLRFHVAQVRPGDLAAIRDQSWFTLVATFCSPDEHPTEGAERLTKYLLAYQETHGRFPSLEAVQKHAADRHLKESR